MTVVTLRAGLARARVLVGAAIFICATISAVPGVAAELAVPDDAVVGDASGQDQVNFVLTLPLRNSAQLDELLRRMYTPGDPQFHHFLSGADFDQRFGPTASQYADLKTLAGEYGLTIVAEHPGRTLLDVAAAAATIRQLFGAQMQVRQQFDGRRYYAPDREAELPFPLAAMGVEAAALSQKPRHPHYLGGRGFAGDAVTLAPSAGLGSGGSYEPADIKTAYNLNSIQNGGQPVALFELSSATYSDAAQYASQFGLHNPTLTQKLVDGGTTDTSGAVEVMLDIEMIMAVSNPTNIIVYTGPNAGSGILDTYTQIADDDLVNQVSTSWGLCEAQMGQSNANAENVVFSKMAAEGIAVFAAAGDSGAYDCGNRTRGLAVDDPASQPYVTGVGGTHLTTTSTQGYSAESVWDTSSSEAGGGGISKFWPRPSYQAGVVSNAPTGQFSTTQRNVPDVALDADPNTGFYIYVTTGGRSMWGIVGGTSDAAPQWAAFWSLIGAGLTKSSGVPSRAGYANPTIYSIAENAASYARDFHDVSSGTNNDFTAVPGYDDATGWGSYNGANLYADVMAAIGGTGVTPPPPPPLPPPAVPPTPTNLQATGSSSGTQGLVTLKWKASTGATGYYVYMGSQSGGESSTPLGSLTGTTVQVTGLARKTTYYFQVTAYNAGGQSSHSAQASAKTR
jgi:kumamolisin